MAGHFLVHIRWQCWDRKGYLERHTMMITFALKTLNRQGIFHSNRQYDSTNGALHRHCGDVAEAWGEARHPRERRIWSRLKENRWSGEGGGYVHNRRIVQGTNLAFKYDMKVILDARKNGPCMFFMILYCGMTLHFNILGLWRPSSPTKMRGYV